MDWNSFGRGNHSRIREKIEKRATLELERVYGAQASSLHYGTKASSLRNRRDNRITPIPWTLSRAAPNFL
jgi:hypothetical protein